jgi:hypothetical protein
VPYREHVPFERLGEIRRVDHGSGRELGALEWKALDSAPDVPLGVRRNVTQPSPALVRLPFCKRSIVTLMPGAIDAEAVALPQLESKPAYVFERNCFTKLSQSLPS